MLPVFHTPLARRDQSPAIPRLLALAALSVSTFLAPGALAQETQLTVDGDLFVDTRPQARGVVHAGDRLWKDGVIPVWFDPQLSASMLESIQDAIDIWNSLAGITFVEIDSDTPPDIDHVHLQPGEGCASWVGQRGGAQELWVAPECTVGSVIHELGHVIGLEHEHTRTDRDEWIRINLDAVIDGRRHNFDKAPEGSRLLGEYDYSSIMHYGRDFFSADGSTTIEPLVPGVSIGQRVVPSAGDIEAVAELYGTDMVIDASLIAVSSTGSATHELSVIVSNDGGNGAHAIEFEVVVPEGWVVEGDVASVEDWNCQIGSAASGSGEEALTCQLERLSADARSFVSIALARDASEDPIRIVEEGQDVAPLLLSLRSGTDEHDASDNQRVVATVDDVRDPLVVTANSPGTPDLARDNPFAVERPDVTEPGPLLSDSASAEDSAVETGGGGASHPGLWLLLLLLRRRRH